MVDMPGLVFTLVHGTFARNARWVQPGSWLRDKLVLEFPDAMFIPFKWSGYNTHKARTEAAAALRSELEAQRDAYPQHTSIIIAHSHGGNVALCALKNRDLQKYVRLVISLNTPFLVPLRRTIGVARGPAVAVLPFGFLLAVPLFYFLTHGTRTGYSIAIWLATFGVFVVFFVGALWLVNTLQWRVKVALRRDDIVQDAGLPRLYETKLCCLWAAGDEVYDFFLLLELLSNLPYIALRPDVIIALLTFITFVCSLGWVPLFPGYALIPIIGDVIDRAAFVAQHTPHLFSVGYNLIASFSSSVLYVLLFTVMAEIWMYSSRFIPLLGGLTIADAQYVRMGASLTPSSGGEINFESLDTSPGGLYHSAIYDNENVINRLIQILQRSLNHSEHEIQC